MNEKFGLGDSNTGELYKPFSDDEVLRTFFLDPDYSRALLLRDPVLWVRCAIGVDTERGASTITDKELAERYNAGGFAEWDPKVAKAVRDYLQEMGFIDLRDAN